MDKLPKDPMMLLSVVNTQLRDFYGDLKSFCDDFEVDEQELKAKLKSIDYEYDARYNKFI